MIFFAPFYLLLPFFFIRSLVSLAVAGAASCKSGRNAVIYAIESFGRNYLYALILSVIWLVGGWSVGVWQPRGSCVK